MTSGSPNRGFDAGRLMSLPSLYHPSFEHDACGIGCIAHLDGKPTHGLIEDALRMLINMEHRGATGADPDTGDGAGILLQLCDPYFQDIAKEVGLELPEKGTYGVGMTFLPKDERLKRRCKSHILACCKELKFELIGYRKVPTRGRHAGIGITARNSEPAIEQVFVKSKEKLGSEVLERKLYVLRKRIALTLDEECQKDFHFASFSSQTIIYKG